jgi:hypothetical protein
MQQFSFSTASRPALGPTQLPTPWVLGALSPGVKRQDREVDHSPLSNTEVKNGGAIPPLSHMSSWDSDSQVIKHKGKFTFIVYEGVI